MTKHPAITPEWLTYALRKAKTLSQGKVIAVDIRESGAFNSETRYLTLTYSDDTPEQAPQHLVIKRNTQEEWCKRAQVREVLFYQTSMPNPLAGIVLCYAAEYDPQSGNSYILLQDLSKTHVAPISREDHIRGDIPAKNHIEAVIDTLATIHAYWWENPLLKTEVARPTIWFETESPVERYVQQRADLWQQLLSSQSDTLPEDMQQDIEQVLARLPHLWEKQLNPRFMTGKNLTLIHGDAYFSNFLCPRNGSGQTYLIDWQSPQVHIGGEDLANMIATFWMPEQRHRQDLEQGMLQRYYKTLIARGVQNYTWDELIIDYKLGLIDWLFMPMWDASNGSSRDYWWPKLLCLYKALQNWHCLEFMAQ